jgi:aspartate racemase
MSLTRIGLIGGMSWESSAVYYRVLNESVRDRLGGHSSATVTLLSVDFAEIERLQRAGDWAAQGRVLAQAGADLEASGVAAVALATNTMHLVADDIRAAITVPFVDLIDLTRDAVARYDTVGLLATGYTMRSSLFSSRLAEVGTEVIVPDAEGQRLVHDMIYDELTVGIVSEASRTAFLDHVAQLAARGAQAVILGCTEIGLLLSDGDAEVPLLDTTLLHCAALVDVIVNGVVAGHGVTRNLVASTGGPS